MQYDLDTVGLVCPEPIMMLHQTMRKVMTDDVIVVMATDPATMRDIPNFCRHLGHELLEQQVLDNNQYRYIIKKG